MGKCQNKNIILRRIIIVFLVVAIIFPLAAKPQKANALMSLVSDPALLAKYITENLKDAWRWAKDYAVKKAEKMYQVATDVAFKNSLRVFFGKFAEDTAVWLASAGTGQKPLFMTDPNYWTDLVDATGGDYLYSLGAHTFGIDVCEPDLQAKLSITFALGKTINPKTWCQDKCTWGLNGKTNDINEKYYNALDPKETVGQKGTEGYIRYFEYYDSDSTFAQFMAEQGTRFGCPITCQEGPPTPGMWCNASFASNMDDETQWEHIPLNSNDIPASRRNLQACLSTIKTLYNNERKIAQGSYQDCARNCRLGARKSKCSLKTAWTNVKNLASSDVLNTMVDTYFQPSQNDIGQLLTIYGLVEEKTRQELAKEKVLWESPQIGPLTAKVSKDILTPREMVQLRGEMALEKGTTPEEVRTGSWTADVVTIFTNTLIDRLVKRFYGGKCALNPSAAGCKGPSGGSKLSQLVFGSGGPSGIAAAKLKFASISQLNFTRGSPGQDPIATSDLTAKGVIDSGLQTAIDQEMTVAEAIEKGLIGGTFGFDAEGREPSLDSGISYRTILYLRKYRVVPVTWELAAKWIKDHPQNITLQKLVEEEYSRCETGGKNFCVGTKAGCQGNSDCYDQAAYPPCTDNTDCVPPLDLCVAESDGGRTACYNQCDPSADPTGCAPDQECRALNVPNLGYCVGNDAPLCQHEVNASPFCGLIDPNWVLKLPATYCQKRGASEEIINKEFICDEDTNGDTKTDCSDKGGDIGRWQVTRNTETCVNEQSCLREDKNGKCVKYGYCFEERPIWRFNGTECPSSFVSCQSYLNSSGTAASYLKKTVDIDSCDATNAGCRWYCQAPDYDAATSKWTCAKDTGSKIHFDRDVLACKEKEAGCQEFIRNLSGTNLAANGSFEYHTGEVNDSLDDQFNDIWVGNGTAPYTCGSAAEAVSDAYTGGVAVKLTWMADCALLDPGHGLIVNETNTGHSILNRTFTFSFYAKADTDLILNSYAANGTGAVHLDYPNHQFNVTTEWQRYSYTEIIDQLYPNNTTPLAPNIVDIVFRSVNGRTVYLDGVQIEEGGLSAYKDYGEANKVYLNKDRLACAAKDVGCEKYTPLKGGSAIPGVVYPQNLCSADRVGCQSFRETAIDQIPQRPARDPIYFISGTGTRCDAANVACEEYTNLDVASQGGEAKEYYRQIRQCVKPDMPAVDIQNFYTWEGSDTKGYQLRAFKLVKSNFSGAPCTNLSIATTTTNPVCQDNAGNLATCAAADMAANPDCTEFYDSAANVYYLLRSRVIKATDQCHPYRNTLDSSDASLADNIYYLIPDESIKCSSGYAGCREYKGNSGRVTRTVFADDFEKTSAGAVNWQTGVLSNESTRADEHSLHVLDNATATSVNNPNILAAGKLAQGRSYQLTFWLKPDGATAINSIAIEQSSNPGNDPQFFLDPASAASPVALTQDWNLYAFGPLQFDRDVLPDEQLTLALNGHFYLDNVSLEEVADTFYLIKDTFVSCAAADLGCQAYKDSKGTTHYIKSFDHLCAEKFIGCEAMINTQNYRSPYQATVKEITIPADTIETIVYKPANACPAAAKGCQKFGLPTLSQTDEPLSFETKYLINDPEKYQYLDDQNQDASIACLASEEGCDEFVYKEGNGTDWFKDPRQKTCEYKVIGASDEYKWYKTGTSLLCPAVTPPSEGRPVGRACVKACQAGKFAGVACVENSDCYACVGGTRDGSSCQTNSDCPNGSCQPYTCGGNESDVGTPCTSDLNCAAGNRCDYWAGLCPEEQSGCNEYRDPSDPAICRTTCALAELGGKPVPVNDNCEPTTCVGGNKTGQMCYESMNCPGGACSGVGLPGCRSYYYLKQSVEENKEECGNMVNAEEGCMPFNDTSNPVLNMRGK